MLAEDYLRNPLVNEAMNMFQHSFRHMILATTLALGAIAEPVIAVDYTLDWNPVNDDRVIGYTLFYGEAYGDYPYSINVGDVTRYTVTNLNPDATYYFAVKAKDTNGVESDFSPVVSSGPYHLLVGKGSDPSAGGQVYAYDQDQALERTIQTSWQEYKALGGETRMTTGDIDGDERDEVVIGLGPVGTLGLPGGRFEILDDDLTHLTWGQVDWPEYNRDNGETRPAIGDVDGDGKGEILIGLGEGGAGLVEVFRFFDGAPEHLAWTGVDWPEYSQENGETWPAAGDANADKKDDIAIGLGKGGGGLFVLKSGFDPSLLDTEEDPWPTEVEGFMTWQEYATEQGETRPAFGDLNGDGKPEVVVGLGKTGAGNVDVFSPAATGLIYLLSTRVEWDDYNLYNGETRPVLGDIDQDSRDEIIVGLGEGGQGYVDIFDDRLSGLVKLSDLQVGTLAYQNDNGSTWPAYKIDRKVAPPPAEILYQLLVTKAGTGDGSLGGGGTYPAGTQVTPTATPQLGSIFSGWTPSTCGAPFALTANTTCTANFVLQTFNLTVTRSGSGTVASTPSGINCGSDCSEVYPAGTAVSLSATPATGYAFSAWSGACTGSGTCSLTLSAARSVTATFKALSKYTLTVKRSGSGTVTSSPTGVTCGSDCKEAYYAGTVVTLTPVPATGYKFARWSGACTGTGACTITMTASKTATATFTR